MEEIEKYLRNEIKSLETLHEENNYVNVVILAPQLMVEVIDTVASYHDDWIERKITSKFSDDDREIYKIVGELQKKESDRSYIVNALLGNYESGEFEGTSARKGFIKYFTKLDDLISLRNIYAHEYYTKEVSNNRAKNCSKSAIELVQLFALGLESETHA